MTTWVFDLDGTLCDTTERLHYILGKKKDWDRFFSEIPMDPPFKQMVDLVKLLGKTPDNTVILQTGRPEKYRNITGDWLKRHGLGSSYQALLMREDGDYTPNTILKMRFVEWIISYTNSTDILWFEDAPAVVEMVNKQGILALSAECFVKQRQTDVHEIPELGDQT